MTTVDIYAVTDADLLAVFGNMPCAMKYRYEVIFRNKYNHAEITIKTVQADNKKEATRFAREYGNRINNSDVVIVTRLEA